VFFVVNAFGCGFVALWLGGEALVIFVS